MPNGSTFSGAGAFEEFGEQFYSTSQPPPTPPGTDGFPQQSEETPYNQVADIRQGHGGDPWLQQTPQVTDEYAQQGGYPQQGGSPQQREYQPFGQAYDSQVYYPMAQDPSMQYTAGGNMYYPPHHAYQDEPQHRSIMEQRRPVITGYYSGGPVG